MSIFSTSYLASSSTDIRFGKRLWQWYLLSNATLNTGCTFIPGGSSNLAALRPIIYSTLNGPTYYRQSSMGLSFSFRCFMDSSTLSPGLMLDFLCTVSARCLLASAYFVNHLWVSVYILCKMDRYSSMAGVYTGYTAISIGRCNL